MDRAPALTLLSRIEQTWTTGNPWPAARQDAWLEAIETLDEGVAGTAFVRLRAEHPESAPSIALYLATAKALTVRDGGSPLEPKCGWCDDTGWVQTAFIWATCGPADWPPPAPGSHESDLAADCPCGYASTDLPFGRPVLASQTYALHAMEWSRARDWSRANATKESL